MSKNEANGPTQRKGRWTKGFSGNPTGGRQKRTDDVPSGPTDVGPAVSNPRLDVGELLGHPDRSAPRAELVSGRRVARRDDWRNSLTGQGIPGRDKRMGGFFAPVSLSFDQLRDLCLGDHLARTAVEMVPKEAKRPGYDITIADEGENDTDGNDIGQEVQTKLKALKADQHIELAGRYARLYGGGAVLLGANDKQTDLSQPLDLDKVTSLDWLTTFEARECIPRFAYGNPSAPKYGDPEIYQITSRAVLPSTNTQYGASLMNVHESRLLIFDGIRVSRYQSTNARMGWGESILTAIWTVLRDFNTAWSSAGVLISDFAQTVIKMKGLWATLAEDDGQSYEDRLTAMDAGRSTTNSIVIDGDDSFERQQTPLSGLPDLLEKFAVRLAAACGMPLTLLFGTSPAGMNATGESDIRFFYDRVDEYRQSTVDPALRKLIQILFRTIGNKREPAKWSLEFRPLWQESPKEIAAAMLTQAQADNTWIQAQVISPEEVANSHWGQGGKYNPHLSIDHESRDAQAAATTGDPTLEDLAAIGRAAPTDPAATALNGAQVSSMIDVVKAAVMGEIPRESAAAIIAAAFPGVTSAEAEKMLGPVGFKAGSTPSAKAAAAVAAVIEPPPDAPGTPPPVAPRADADCSKDALLRRLSPNGRCAACHEPGAIEVDHIDGRDWIPRAVSKTQRVARYWDELDRGVKLRALCRSCNARDGAKNKQDHPRADEWDESLHPRAPDGKFGEGVSDRATASLQDAGFVTEHMSRLSAAGDEARAAFPRAEQAHDAAHAAAQKAIHAETMRVHAEHAAASGPNQAKLLDVAEGRRWIAKSRGEGAEGQHAAALEGIEHGKAELAQEQADAHNTAQAVKAGHVSTEIPHTAQDHFVAEHERVVSEIAGQREALDTAHETAAQAIGKLHALGLTSEDGEHDWSTKVDKTASLHEAFDETSQALAEHTGAKERESFDRSAAAEAAEHGTGFPAAPEEHEHHEDLDALKEEQVEHAASKPEPPEHDPDATPEENATAHEEHQQELANWHAESESLKSARAGLEKRVAEQAAEQTAHEHALVQHEAEFKTRASAAQKALEALHEKQLEAAKKLPNLEKQHETAKEAAQAEVDGLDGDHLVNHAAVAHDENARGRAAQASESVLNAESSRRQETHTLSFDDTHESLKAEISATVSAIRQLAKVTGDAPRIPGKPTRAKAKK